MDGIGELPQPDRFLRGHHDFFNIGPTAEIFDAYGPFMAPFFEANKQVACQSTTRSCGAAPSWSTSASARPT